LQTSSERERDGLKHGINNVTLKSIDRVQINYNLQVLLSVIVNNGDPPLNRAALQGVSYKNRQVQGVSIKQRLYTLLYILRL